MESQDYIYYKYYWRNFLLKVLSEFENIKLLDNKINIFIDIFGNNIFDQNNNHYSRQFNHLIKKITHNRGKVLLCKYDNLSLRF